jgi:hypothetical protein
VVYLALVVHANRINSFYVIESLDAALQQPIFNLCSQSIMIKLEKKGRESKLMKHPVAEERNIQNRKKTKYFD